MKDLRNIYSSLPILRDEGLTNIFLYGNQIYDDKTNQIILMHVYDILKIHKEISICPKLLLTSYTFTLFNTHKM